jgi:hypothetical protein
MAKIPYIIIPPGWQPLIDKILRWYDSQTNPTVTSRMFFGTRKQKAHNSSVSFFKEIASVWNPLDAPTKTAWSDAAAEHGSYGYRFFMADYSYRKKNGLSLPGTANDYHQLQGLTLLNPGGTEEVQAIWRTIAVTGQITISFNFKKVQNDVPVDYSFRVYARASYFEGGENKYEEHTYTSDTGNCDWSNVSFSFGTTGRYYFELEVFLQLDFYDAVVDIDNFKVSDASGEVYYEYFNPKAPLYWDPTLLVRKEGWQFLPEYSDTYFVSRYLG